MQRPLCETEESELWFDPILFEEAIKICHECPLLDKCATLGQNEEYGIWGATTPYDRGYFHEEDGQELFHD